MPRAVHKHVARPLTVFRELPASARILRRLGAAVSSTVARVADALTRPATPAEEFLLAFFKEQDHAAKFRIFNLSPSKFASLLQKLHEFEMFWLLSIQRDIQVSSFVFIHAANAIHSLVSEDLLKVEVKVTVKAPRLVKLGRENKGHACKQLEREM